MSDGSAYGVLLKVESIETIDRESLKKSLGGDFLKSRALIYYRINFEKDSIYNLKIKNNFSYNTPTPVLITYDKLKNYLSGNIQ